MPRFLEVSDTATARAALGVQATSVDTFNVKDYGAVGDKSTDDTSAIQAAIDDAVTSAASGAHPVVRFPAGLYLVNGGLTVDGNNIHFVGDSFDATEIHRTVVSETPVILVDGSRFTLESLSIRNAEDSYGSDTDGGRSVAVRLQGTTSGQPDNAVDCAIHSVIINGFYAGISIFGQGLAVFDCAFGRTIHGAILDFPDDDEIFFKNDLESYASEGFRMFRFENIRLHATTGAFIKNRGDNAAYLRSCILSNITADVGAELWDGVMSNTIVTNWSVELSGGNNPQVFKLAPGSHDSMILNGRVLGRLGSADPAITERSANNVMVCNDVTNLHVRNLHIENTKQHAFDFTGFVHGLYMSGVHFKNVGYSGSSYRQILHRTADIQAYLSDLTFDLPAGSTLIPVGGGPKTSDTVLIGSNITQINTDQTVDLFGAAAGGTVVVNGHGLEAPVSGTWKSGDVVWNQTSGSPMGWRCTSSGSPGTWKAINPYGTATLNFGALSANSYEDLTISVTGAATGDTVSLGVPTAAVTAGVAFTAWVSAADTVTVRAHNYTSGTPNPGSGTFKATITS